MLKACNGNRVLRIPDEKKADYIALGYKITDMGGKVIYDPINNSEDVKEMKKAIIEKDKTIADLNVKIEEAQNCRHNLFEELNQKVTDLEAALAEKDAVIAELDKTIADLNAKIKDGEKEAKKTASKAAK